MSEPILVVVERGTYCLMGWAGPHLMNSQMSAACLCKLDDDHDRRHLCAVLGCKSWKAPRDEDPQWNEEDNDE